MCIVYVYLQIWNDMIFPMNVISIFFYSEYFYHYLIELFLSSKWAPLSVPQFP